MLRDSPQAGTQRRSEFDDIIQGLNRVEGDCIQIRGQLARSQRDAASLSAQLERNTKEIEALRARLARDLQAGAESAERAPPGAAPSALPAPGLPAHSEGDPDLALALALSLAQAPLLQSEEDDELVRALALSLSPAPRAPGQGQKDKGDAPEALEARKRREEELTALVLGGVECLEVGGSEEIDGTVSIGAQRYRRVEHGSAHAGHENLCFYLAVTEGRGDLAVRLKEELAPDATSLSRAIGTHTDFTALATRADTEVVRVYVLRRRVTAVVYNSRARRAVSHWTDGSLGATIYLYTDGAHYQRLVPI